MFYFSLKKDPHHALRELARICVMADCTLILAWRYHREHIKLTSFNKKTRIRNIFLL